MALTDKRKRANDNVAPKAGSSEAAQNSQTPAKEDLKKMREMLAQSYKKAELMSEAEASARATQPRNWERMSRQDKEAVMLKALEMTLHGKELSKAVAQTIPPQVAQELAALVQLQRKHRTLGTRALPERLQALVNRLRNRGLLDKPHQSDNPLDRLTPKQRRVQEAAEALELRRQNAVQMTEAVKLLPKK